MPDRNVRRLPPVEIPSELLDGEARDWRAAVREFIATNLQGQTLRNEDTGWDIAFNSESRGESVSKLRREPQFRAALQVVPIVERAIHLGDVQPNAARAKDTERFCYFAIPGAHRRPQRGGLV